MENFNNDFNNYYNQNNNMFGNMPQGQYNPPPELRYKGWKTASLIFGLLSLLTCLLFFISMPLGTIGFLLAIIYICLTKKMCAGLWINIGSMILSFVLIFVIIFSLAFMSSDVPVETSHSMDVNSPIETVESEELNAFESFIMKIGDFFIDTIERDNSKLQGTWELIDYTDEIIEGKEKVAKCTFNEDKTFVWSKYGAETTDYVKGTYRISSISVVNNEWTYSITLNIKESAIEGIPQTETFSEDFEAFIVVEKNKTEAIFYNEETGGMFYSVK